MNTITPDIRRVTLLRQRTSDQGTEGVFTTDTNFTCFSLELPWRDNTPGKSCIPAGEYKVQLRKSPKFGTVYWVTNVAQREYILIHSGNYAGDVDKGYKSHVLGCILPGLSRAIMGGQKAVTNSKTALRRFMDNLGGKPFILNIQDGDGVNTYLGG